ncbi:hypothetical protein [Patulibacter minatonensis]|uniref:hypothetical protein n=1 Tax=Patulibacter minatonensis TaxID=298163 RepID=UPI0004794398|nr:hypothetical protein [Patulibacter minatonensis]
MARSPRILVVALVAGAALPATAATAGAAVRYAAPTGASSGACPVGTPCTLGAALTGAAVGDEIVLTPGSYTQPTQVTSPSGSYVHGQAGQPRPTITFGDVFGMRVGSYGRISDVDLVGTSTAGGTPLTAFAGSVVERVSSRAVGNASGARVMDGDLVTIRDSSFVAESGFGVQVSGPAAFGSVSAQLDHVTAVANGATGAGIRVESVAGRSAQATVTGSILRGPTNDASVVKATDSATLNVASSFARLASFSTTGAPTVVNGGGNSTATPLFVGAASGDVHQAAGSPTIDAAGAAPGSSGLDVDGDPRTLGDAPDAGADEFRPAPVAITGAPSNITTNGATVAGIADTKGLAGTWKVEYGPTDAYGSATTPRSLAAGRGQTEVAAALEGLAAGANSHYRFVVTTSGGTTNGPDIALTTLAPAAPTLVPVPGPTVTVPGKTTTVAAASPKLTGLKVKGTTLSYTASAAGQVRIVVKRGSRTVKTLVKTVRKGKGTIALGRLGKGSYKLSVTATTAPGKAATVGFRKK